MSNIAYFTTSPAILMRRRQAAGSTTTTTSTSTTTSTTSTSTTTTTTCPVYSLDIYVRFSLEPNIGCDCFICPDCSNESYELQYSDDAGSNWNYLASLNSLTTACTFVSTQTIDTCLVTDYRLRVFATEPCGTEVYIKAAYDAVGCIKGGACGDCTLTETANLVGYSNVRITVCQECVDNCPRPCCV